MPPRLARPAILLALVTACTACGDDGSATATTAGATTTASELTTTGTATGGPGPAPTSTAGTSTGAVDTSTETTNTTADPDPTGELDPTTTGGPATSTTTATTADATTTGDATTTDDATTGELVMCGNGIVEPGEQCDLGIENSELGACSPQCQLPVCGDGVVQASETCDDGSGVGCDTYHDGGAGTCVPADTCSDGFILSAGDCIPEVVTDHVHIEVDNFCKMKVTPSEFTVQPGQKLQLSYHNHSVDYPVDVWMHYGGGFTDLPPGQTWNEKYEHCFGPAPSEGWAEISTACSQYELPIHCK